MSGQRIINIEDFAVSGVNLEKLLTFTEDKIYLALKIVPGSSKNQICEVKENRLKIKIAAAAEDNKANEELRSFLSKQFECAKKDILIITGEKSRLKTVSLPVYAREKLESLIELFIN